MRTATYTLEVGRTIHRDGKPFALVQIVRGHSNHEEVNAFARTVVDRMNVAAGSAAIVAALREGIDADVHADDCAFMRDNIVQAHKDNRPVADCNCWRSRAVRALTDHAPGTDAVAIDAIAALLDGEEWDGDTAVEIARVVRATGRKVGDVR